MSRTICHARPLAGRLLLPFLLAAATPGLAADVSAYLRALDQNGDHLISMVELHTLPRLASGFDAADSDRNGLLDGEELEALLRMPTGEGPVAGASGRSPRGGE